MTNIPKELDSRQIHELLIFLLEEREKVEQVSHRLDHDQKLTWKYINKKIQKLNLLLFRHEFEEHLKQLQSALTKTKGVE